MTTEIRKISVFIIFCLLLSYCSVSLAKHQPEYITVEFQDSIKSATIPIYHEKNCVYFSLSELARILNVTMDWDFVGGETHLFYHDVELGISTSGNIYKLNGIWYGSECQFIQTMTDCWASVELLQDILSYWGEGNVVWNPSTFVIKVLGQKSKIADSHRMDPFVVVLDPGHGGADLGCLDIVSRMYEKDMALNMVQALSKILEERLGVRVILTREKDINISEVRRVATANNAKADLFISLHFASRVCRNNVSSSGFAVYFPDIPKYQKYHNEKNEIITPWEYINQSICEQSKAIAEKFKHVLSRISGNEIGCVYPENLAIFKGLRVPGVLLELSFDASFYGDISVSDPAGRRRAIESIFDAIKTVLLEKE